MRAEMRESHARCVGLGMYGVNINSNSNPKCVPKISDDVVRCSVE
jgi:hypothetical protein